MRFGNRNKPDVTSFESDQQPSNRLLSRFKQAVGSTRRTIFEKLGDVAKGKRQIDAEVFEHLEEALIGADIGPRTTSEILQRAQREVDRDLLSDFDQLKNYVKAELLSILNRSNRQVQPEGTSAAGRPQVRLVVGVNGSGKTTTIGKLAHKLKREKLDLLLCGADTFRAAANDQLAIWAERAGVPLIQQPPGADPAAVVFDALKAAKARGTDVVLIDTAGRLHTKVNLMQELAKINRVAAREVEGAPHEVLLVIDAITGQNGLEQARQFLSRVSVTGLILTKLDGTAKGGIAVAIAKELKLPIRYVGLGERIDDLAVFSAQFYVDSLFDD